MRQRIFAGLAGTLITCFVASAAYAHHAMSTFGEGGGGPINTIGAETLPKGKGAMSLRLEFLDLDRFSDQELLDFGAAGIQADSSDYAFSAFLGGAYGVTDKLTVGARIPYIFRDDIREPEVEDGMVSVSDEGDSVGHGDLKLFGAYRFLRLEDRKLELAALAGLSVPTGYTHAHTREGDRFETEHQPGSGSWDPAIGLAVSKTWGKFSLHSNVYYSFATQGAQDTNLGDSFTYNLAAVYHLGGVDPDHHHDEAEEARGDDAHQHEEVEPHRHKGVSWDVIVELNGSWEERINVAGVTDPNSGGNQLFFAPGVRVTFNERWSIFASGGVPIWQDVNGKNHQADYRIVTGFGVAF